MTAVPPLIFSSTTIQASRVAMKQPGATVEVTLEIDAQIPGWAPDDLKRTVSENCSTLKFKNFDFEDE
jgi:hypothetical protein